LSFGSNAHHLRVSIITHAAFDGKNKKPGRLAGRTLPGDSPYCNFKVIIHRFTFKPVFTACKTLPICVVFAPAQAFVFLVNQFKLPSATVTLDDVATTNLPQNLSHRQHLREFILATLLYDVMPSNTSTKCPAPRKMRRANITYSSQK
jgi:hypothetical protein